MSSTRKTDMGPTNIWARSYLSNHHRECAVKLASDCYVAERNGNQENALYCLASVISAVSFLEASINELYADCLEKPIFLGTLRKDAIERISVFSQSFKESKSGPTILEKYQLAFVCITGSRIDKGRNPFQDASLLVWFRNKLVHYQPVDVLVDPSNNDDYTHEIEKKLSRKFPKNRLASSSQLFFPEKCLGYGCARWAVLSSSALFDQLNAAMGLISDTYSEACSILPEFTE